MSIIRLQAAPDPEDPDTYLAAMDSDEIPAFRRYAGSFSTESATHWDSSDDTTDRVWLTPSGRWVVTSRKHGDAYITTDWARAWLTRHGWAQVVAEHIDVEHDGPGQPEIGPEVKFRMPEKVRDAIDAMAAHNGVSRAAQLRMIVMDVVPLGS